MVSWTPSHLYIFNSYEPSKCPNSNPSPTPSPIALTLALVPSPSPSPSPSPIAYNYIIFNHVLYVYTVQQTEHNQSLGVDTTEQQSAENGVQVKPNAVYGINTQRDEIQMKLPSQNLSQGVDSTEQQSAGDEVQVKPNVVYGISDGIQMNTNMVYGMKPPPSSSAEEDSQDYMINNLQETYYSTINWN